MHHGGGIWATGNSTVTLGKNVLIEGNVAAHEGGGLCSEAQSTIELGDFAVVQHNEAGMIGGGKPMMCVVCWCAGVEKGDHVVRLVYVLIHLRTSHSISQAATPWTPGTW